jgi:putative addiction module killer protein
MFEIIQSETFRKWREHLKDRHALLRLNARLQRVANGNLGDVKPIGEGLSELRIDYGAGYRIYFMQRGHRLIVLLVGGDKRTQDADIKRAIAMAKTWED